MAKRRTRAQWQVLVDEQATSGLSAIRFCERYDLGYASFCNWRKRLSSQQAADSQQPSGSVASAATSSPGAPGFVDLASLAGGPSGGSTPGAWNIVLSLGNGVELTLSQAG